jgi:hypothetical protein
MLTFRLLRKFLVIDMGCLVPVVSKRLIRTTDWVEEAVDGVPGVAGVAGVSDMGSMMLSGFAVSGREAFCVCVVFEAGDLAAEGADSVGAVELDSGGDDDDECGAGAMEGSDCAEAGSRDGWGGSMVWRDLE